MTIAADLFEGVLGSLKTLVDPDDLARIDRIDVPLNEFGVDPFGFDPATLKLAAPIGLFLYRHYFRVEVHGILNVPPGRVMLIGNHSGQIPIDAAMIVTAMMLEAEPPRMLRSMMETWVPSLPIISYFFERCGQIVGTRENCMKVLEAEQPILAFPEGVHGVNKPFSRRYQLEEFGLGFMRLALMTGAPIVPVAVIGAEEQTVCLWNAESLARLVGMPSLPITPLMPLLGPLALLPLPTKYHLHFGRPMRFEGDPDDEDASIAELVNQVRGALSRMIHDGRKARRHVFW